LRCIAPRQARWACTSTIRADFVRRAHGATCATVVRVGLGIKARSTTRQLERIIALTLPALTRLPGAARLPTNTTVVVVIRKSLASVRLLAPHLAIRARTVTPGTDLPGRTHSGTSATVVGVDQVRLAHAAADDLVRQVTHAVSTLAVLVRAAGFAAGAAVGVFRKGLACLCQGTVGLASGACTLESGACVLASLVAGAHGAARTTVVLQGQIGTCPRAGVGLPADLEGTRTLAAARLINPEYTCLA
jgi:hypothetical protein